MKNKETVTLREVVDLLLLNASCLGNVGLYHGKMGFVLFLCQYAKRSKCQLYDDFAGILFEESSEDLHADLSFSLEDGLCGIGWGVEYLVQNCFMEGDTDEILKEIDERIMFYDPLWIKNLSLRRGLGGLIYYVTIRLSSPGRKPGICPFDKDYLDKLRVASLKNDFSREENLPAGLVDNFLKALVGKGKSIPVISDLFPITCLDDIDSGRLLMDGIEAAWGLLESGKEMETLVHPRKKGGEKKQLYLFCEESRSTNYGIGTYLRQVTEALKDGEWEVTIITLYASKVLTLSEESTDGATFIAIGGRKVNRYERLKVSLSKMQDSNRYYTSALLLLQSRLVDDGQSVVLLNQMDMADFAVCLKREYPHVAIIGIVHYMNWCFALNGNQQLFRKILSDPAEDKNKSLISGFENEKRFLHLCDKVVAISQHSLQKIVDFYQIAPEKITLVRHGICDRYQPATEDKKLLRSKYGFQPADIVLLFVGRLEAIKGIDLLVKAFAGLRENHPELKLLVAGDGYQDLIWKNRLPCGPSIVTTGFVDQLVLQELYAIADIGIVPSLYEDFGYVALEMMTMGLPLLVGGGSGLEEIVKEGETGLVVPFNVGVELDDEVEKNVLLLKKKIEQLLSLPWKEMGKKGRRLYLSTYNIKRFANDLVKAIDNESIKNLRQRASLNLLPI